MKVEIRSTLALVLLGSLGCDDARIGAGARREVPLVLHDGWDHRVVVKLADGEVAGASGGKVDLVAGAASAEVAVLAAERGLELRPLLTLPDAKLDALGATTQTDLRGLVAVAAPDLAPAALYELALELRSMDGVEYVYLEPLGVPPPGDLDPVTDDYSAQQTYRGAGALELDAVAAAPGAAGEGVRLIDIEYGWNLQHEDLVDRVAVMEPGQTIPPDVAAFGWDDHGTAVVGITSATPNAYGVSGLVPAAELSLFPEWSVEEGWRRAAAVAAGLAAARPGDVVLLEMQTVGPGGNYGPAEIDPAIWTLVKAATDAGVVVVAAAGNGAEDLDGALYDEYRGRGDSGAIVVGAGASVARLRLGFSTYGARVNVHGWGENVVTLGYGDLAIVGGDPNQEYTAFFAGTSSASPLVASAAVALQGHALSVLGRPLTPAELRQLLVETGTPQDAGDAGAIGPLPHLPRAFEALDQMVPPPASSGE